MEITSFVALFDLAKKTCPVTKGDLHCNRFQKYGSANNI